MEFKEAGTGGFKLSISSEQVVENTLKEAINFLKLRPDLFQEINRFTASRLLDASRAMNDGQLFLLQFSIRAFDTPFREYFDRLFRKEIKNYHLRDRIKEKGFEEGVAILAMTVINELNIRDCIEIEGGIDEKTIKEKLSKRLKIIGDEEKIRVVFWEIIRVIEEVLSKVTEIGSKELRKLYERLLETIKTGGISTVKNEIENYTIEFDAKIRREFVVE